jgi:hypothetical protein
MNQSADDGSGIALLLRPLFFELSETQIATIEQAQVDADEEAFVTALVDRVRRYERLRDLEHQLVLLRAWAARTEVLATSASSFQVWLRVLERDAELHGGLKWRGNLHSVDLYPARYHRESDAPTPVWDILTKTLA